MLIGVYVEAVPTANHSLKIRIGGLCDC